MFQFCFLKYKETPRPPDVGSTNRRRAFGEQNSSLGCRNSEFVLSPVAGLMGREPNLT